MSKDTNWDRPDEKLTPEAREWVEKFYPCPAADMMTAPSIDAVNHSLRKWEGLRDENLEAAGITYGEGRDLEDADGNHVLRISGDSCSLCVKFYDASKRGNAGCAGCPLYESSPADVHHHPCNGEESEFEQYLEGDEDGYSDPEPMILALEVARDFVLAMSKHKF